MSERRAQEVALTEVEFRERLAALGLRLDAVDFAAALEGARRLRAAAAELEAWLAQAPDAPPP